MGDSKYMKNKQHAWDTLEAIFSLPTTSIRAKLFHKYAKSELCNCGRNFLLALGSLFDELPASEVISRLNTEILLRYRAGQTYNFTRVRLCARDADIAWEKYLKNNRNWQKIKQPGIEELRRFNLRFGESGILEGGHTETDKPHTFEDEQNGTGPIAMKATRPGVDDEGSVIEDSDMSVPEQEHVQGKDRIVAHSKTVCTILARCYDILTLLVGPEREMFVCHKLLICFFTESVNRYCRENIEATEQKPVKIVNKCPTQIRMFTAWMYSGLIDTILPSELEHLWVLGDRFSSPAFANAVMFQLFEKYGSGTRWITAGTTEYVYGATDEGSKLRLFVKAVIASHGPLSPRSLASNTKEFQEEWHSIIRQGGEIVLDIAVHSSFSNDDPSRSPCKRENQADYLPFTNTVDDFLRLQEELKEENMGGNTSEEVDML